MKKLYLKDIANIFNVSESTLRYYDSKGLLLRMERDSNNYRFMHEKDIEIIRVIICLKQTGMDLKKISKYLHLVQKGETTLEERYEMIVKQHSLSLNHLESIKSQINYLEYKKDLYKKLLNKN